MARKPSRIALGALLLPILLAIAAAPAGAMGSRENPLAVADDLIGQQKYNEAVEVLTAYIRENPDRFDQAQRRLRKIVEIRSQYNKEANLLLKSLVEDPENEDLHLRLIRKLEEMERNPSPEVQEFVEQTKLAILFTKNRVQLERIMEEGQALAGQGRFTESARRYTAGFELYRPEFEFGGFDPITVRAAFQRISDVESQIGRFEASQPSLNASAALLRDAFTSGDPGRMDAALPAAEDVLAALAGLRTETLAAGEALRTQFELFRKANPELTDDSFLPFAYRFILGRSDAEKPEGIAGAMASQWAALFDSVSGSADATLDRQMADAGTAFSDGRFPASDTSYQAAKATAERALRFQGLWSLFLPTDVTDPPSAFGRTIVSVRGSDYLRLQHLRDTAEASAALAALRTELAAQETRERELTAALDAVLAGTGSPESALSDGLTVLRGLRTRTAELRKGISELDAAARARGAELAKLSGSGNPPRGALEVQTAFESRIAGSSETAAAFEVRTVALAAKAETDVQEYRLKARTDDLARARRLAEGAVPEGAPEGTPPLPYSAQIILDEIQKADGLLTALRRDAAVIVSQYSGEPEAFSSAPSVLAQIDRARALDAPAAKLASEGRALAQTARDRQLAAGSAKAEADLRLRQARDALASDNLETAKNRLSEARQKYTESLQLDYKRDVEQTSDAQIKDLNERISKRAQDLALKKKAALLSEGKSLYNAGEFGAAVDRLEQAQKAGNEAGLPEDKVVSIYLGLAKAALAVRTDRVVLPTDSKYGSISTLLSLAKESFEAGKAALARKDEAQAREAWVAARQRISEIKSEFPKNQEARILELRIDQMEDEKKFRDQFKLMVDQARTRIDNGKELETAYNDLKDLETLDPGNLDLQDKILKLEYVLGLKKRPPDERALSESEALTNEARTIYNSGETRRYPTAITRLDRALELNPDNERAIELRDLLQSRIGGTVSLVLPSSAAESAFNAIQQLIREGKWNSARSALTRLYATYPQARSVLKVKELDELLVTKGVP